MRDNIEIYTLYTLVDITPTGVTRGPDSLRRDQQRNWETVVQTVSLIAQPTEISAVQVTEAPMEWCKFGDFYEGTFKVWAWRFSVEHTDVFLKDDNPVGRLEELFEQIPIISGLEETARFMLPIFYPYGAIKNIYFIKNT
jgi:hypothetical protein